MQGNLAWGNGYLPLPKTMALLCLQSSYWRTRALGRWLHDFKLCLAFYPGARR